MTDECKREMSKLIIAAEEHALQYLESMEPALDAEGRHAAGLLKSEYNANLAALRLRVARVEAEAAAEAREEAREAAEEKCAVAPDSTAKLEAITGIDIPKVTPESKRVLDAAEVRKAQLEAVMESPSEVRGTFLGKRRVKAKTRDIEAEALSMELEQIRLMREAGRLTNADARELREEVYMLQMGLEAR